MKLDRFLRHFRKGNLAAAGETLGNELPRKRLWLLAQTRAMLANQNLKEVDGQGKVPAYTLGYRDAMLDILAAYDSAVREEIGDMIAEPFVGAENNED